MQLPPSRRGLLLALFVPVLAGCGAGGDLVDGIVGDTSSAPPTVLHQAAYVSGTGESVVGAGGSYPEIPVAIVGDDVDPTRWAAFHDGSDYRLAFMARDLPPRVILFGYDPSVGRYTRTYPAPMVVPLKNVPSDADLSSFAMLRADGFWRLYLERRGDARTLYQFAYDGGAFRWGLGSLFSISMVGLPPDADPTRWAMHYGGGVYRVIVGSHTKPTTFYELGFDPATYDYVYGYASRDVVTVKGLPSGAIRERFASLYADGLYHLYFLGD